MTGKKKIAFTLAEVFSRHSDGQRRVAFTLAEVLITLGIIGVVAAMTMPSLIQKHQEQVTINKLKKFYSVMSNAMLLAMNDHGTLDMWNVPDGWTKESVTIFGEYFRPYLLISKDCGVAPGCLGYEANVTLLSGNEHVVNYDTDERYYKFILNDGSHVILRPTQGRVYCGETDGAVNMSCGSLWIDINGKKAPNTMGRDIFNFSFTKDRLFPTPNDDCRMDAGGFGCSAYIFANGNMNYLH